MSFNLAFLPIGILFCIGFATMFIVVKLLSKEVSRERLNEIEDLSTLWKNSFPPKSVLTDKGRKILKWYFVIIVALVVVALCLGLLTGFSNSFIKFT